MDLGKGTMASNTGPISQGPTGTFRGILSCLIRTYVCCVKADVVVQKKHKRSTVYQVRKDADFENLFRELIAHVYKLRFIGIQ